MRGKEGCRLSNRVLFRSRPWLTGIACLLVAACGSIDSDEVVPIDQVRAEYKLGPVSPRSFSVCHEHGCQERSSVSLTDAQWAEVWALFDPPSVDAVQERARIALAIGLIERLVAPQARTGGDVGGTFQGVGRGRGQLDCEDEAANTTQYLAMLSDERLIRFHRIVGWAWRGHFLRGWPHTATVIEEQGSGARWAVDSWFEDNGRPAHVVPVRVWKSGWEPAR